MPDATADADAGTIGGVENEARAVLRWAGGTGPSFEDMDSADGDNVYLLTVTASDGVASKSQAVSVTVNNIEETGVITLSQRVPQEGIAITARLSDQDGNITDTEWQWYRGVTDTEDPRSTGIVASADIPLDTTDLLLSANANAATPVLTDCLDRVAPRLRPTHRKAADANRWPRLHRRRPPLTPRS